MDFAYLDAEVTEVKDSNGFNVNGSKPGTLAQRSKANLAAPNYKTGVVKQASAALMVPPAIQSKLSHISTVYGLPFDIGAVSLEIATPENLNALRNIVDMFSRNSKLLPEILGLVKKLMKADIRLAEYHKGVTQAALKHQESIDKETADIFAMMSKAAVKADAREHKVNRRVELRNQKHEAWLNFYDGSVIGDAMSVINTEFQQMANTAKLKKDATVNRVNLRTQREADDISHDVMAHQSTGATATATAEPPRNRKSKKVK